MGCRHEDRSSASSGFTLIELLVVVFLVAILSFTAATTLGPKSPRATRVALSDLRGALVNARTLAASTGQLVVMQVDPTTMTFNYYAVKGTDPSDPANYLQLETSPRSSISLEPAWKRYASVVYALPIVGSETVPPNTVPAMNTLLGGGAGWGNPMLLTTAMYGFSPDGTPQMLTAPGGPLLNLNSGAWIGVAGLKPNQSGVPYGVVLVTSQGQIMAFYKADSQLNTAPEYVWTRMD